MATGCNNNTASTLRGRACQWGQIGEGISIRDCTEIHQTCHMLDQVCNELTGFNGHVGDLAITVPESVIEPPVTVIAIDFEAQS
ncbi:MAG: hypothetical protein NTZ34_06150 [Chloroflexi bacterium]|nr:hypothetical protein [Chloroflexota bacterium]